VADPDTRGEPRPESPRAVRVEDQAAAPGGFAGAIRVITIDRPHALNAIDGATMRALAGAFEACARAAAATPGLRAVIVTGAGDKAFISGADIAALSVLSSAEAGELSRLGHQVTELIEALPVPVIAAVNGYALGGGCELALACDFIYASETARFGQPEVRLGVIPGFGGTVRLARRVGLARARELLFTGETIDATEALRIGVVNRVLEPGQLLPAAVRTAAAVAACAPLAVASAKRALAGSAVERSSQAQALRMESDLFAALFATEDLRAGMRAFLAKDKQPPQWQAR